MEFRMLGALEAQRDGLPISLAGPKQRSVLAMLLLDANRVVSTDRLVDGLWGEDPPLRASATLHVYVSNLRKVLETDWSPRAEPSVLLTQPPGYVLAIDPAQVDVFRFEEMIAVARALRGEGCVVGAAVLLREALTLWRGTPLADLVGEPFAGVEVARLEELRTGAIEDRIDVDLVLGRDVELLPELELLVVRSPYRERLRGQLMLALYRAGRQADALVAYQAARRALVDELGLEPSRELRELEAAILVQDEGLQAPRLVPFGEAEAARVLVAANGVAPSAAIDAVMAEGCDSHQRFEEALRREIEGQQAARLETTIVAAGATHAELIRARHVIADGVLDRRARHAPLAAMPSRVAAGRAGSLPAASPCPYKGLLRFEHEDASWYFGRERLVAELLGMVATTRCTSIVGASGSGKSSLVRAGLLAALRDDALPGSANWPHVLLVPGTDPLLELARALALVSHAASPDSVRDRLIEAPESVSNLTTRALDGRDPDSRLVLVVDQLEEVFTVCDDEVTRDRFLEVLVHAARDPEARTTVVVAIRADYYGWFAAHPEPAALLAGANVLVGPMRPDELQRAMEEPARRAGLVLEDGLVEQIFDDVGTEPGALPLLETALLETWIRRSGHMLTLEGYAAAGGVRGAVAQLADDVYERLSAVEREVARGLLLRLAEPGVGTDDVRRRAPLEELVVDEEHARVLATLVENRLVVAGDVTAEVAHEALLREWPRLRGWLETDREGRRVQHALSSAAQDWARGQRDDDLLFRGSRLVAALDVADAHPAEINPVERDFLAAGRARQDSELRAARTTARRFRRLTVALALFLVVALVAAVAALDQRQNAQDESSRTRARQLAAESRSLLASKLAVPLLLAEESYRLDPGAAVTRGALQASVSSSSGLERLLPFGAASRTIVSRDGRLLADATANGAVHLYDLAHDRSLGALPAAASAGHDPVTSVLLSPDGARAGVSVGKRIKLWDVATRRSVGSFRTSRNGYAYLADAETLFTADEGGIVSRWDVADPTHPVRSDVAAGPGSPAGFPPFMVARLDLHLLAVSYDNVALHIYQLPDAGPASELAVVPGGSGAFSPDGTRLAVSELANTAIYDMADRSQPVAQLRVSTPAWNADFPFTAPLWAPDGRWVAVGSFQRVVSMLDAGDLNPWRDPLDTHGEYASPLAVLDGGRHIVTTVERQVGIWRVATRAPLARQLTGHTRTAGTSLADATASLVTSPTFLGNGQLVTAGLDDATTIVHDLATGEPRRWLSPTYGAVVEFALSADRRRVAVVDRDWAVTVWDRLRATKLGGVLGPDVGASPVDATFVGLSPDGRTVAVGRSSEGSVRLWDVDAGRFIGAPIRVTEPGAYPPVITLVFSPHGRTVALTAATSNVILFVDARHGHVTRRIVDPRVGGFGGTAWSPDGGRLAALGLSRMLDVTSVWDTASGARLGSVSGHEIPPFGVAFSPDGRTFATNSSETILWDASSFSPIGPPLDVGDESFDFGYSIAFSPDGTTLAAAYGNGKLATWDVDARSWARRACEIAGRNLTRAEWHQYIPDRSYQRTCTRWPASI
jgi:DNA-binding SARP family transcriptional activator/WD40 repeat protein